MKNKNKKIGQSKQVDHSKFTGKDGYLVGGVEIEMSKPNESQKDVVQGQECRNGGRSLRLSGTVQPRPGARRR